MLYNAGGLAHPMGPLVLLEPNEESRRRLLREEGRAEQGRGGRFQCRLRKADSR